MAIIEKRTKEHSEKHYPSYTGEKPCDWQMRKSFCESNFMDGYNRAINDIEIFISKQSDLPTNIITRFKQQSND